MFAWLRERKKKKEEAAKLAAAAAKVKNDERLDFAIASCSGVTMSYNGEDADPSISPYDIKAWLRELRTLRLKAAVGDSHVR